MTGTRVHDSYKNMLDRCNNPNNMAYHNYGGRGIKVNFASFADFYVEVGDSPGSQYSIDRINNDGNYEAGNVRWALASEQRRNSRQNHWLTWQGRTQILKDWSKELNIPISTLSSRLARGESGDRLFRPIETTVDLTAKRFGKLVVLSYDGMRGTNRKRAYWLCRCDCGKTKIVGSKNLESGTSSCGCLAREAAAKLAKTLVLKRWKKSERKEINHGE